MLGQLQADSGRIHVGTKLEVAYFDQHRAELDPDKTVMDNLAEGKQEVMVNGKPRHVLGYLQDFLFHPKRAMTPVRALSGGERNRLLLARLFLKPSNLLILDEPTTGVDPLSRAQFWELIDSIRQRQPAMSVLVATAYMEEAERFDWLVAMNAGEVLATGSAAELKAQTGSQILEQALSPCCQKHSVRRIGR